MNSRDVVVFKISTQCLRDFSLELIGTLTGTSRSDLKEVISSLNLPLSRVIANRFHVRTNEILK